MTNPIYQSSRYAQSGNRSDGDVRDFTACAVNRVENVRSNPEARRQRGQPRKLRARVAATGFWRDNAAAFEKLLDRKDIATISYASLGNALGIKISDPTRARPRTSTFPGPRLRRTSSSFAPAAHELSELDHAGSSSQAASHGC